MYYNENFGNLLKWVSVRYNSGWGGPGDWSITFSDATSMTVDNGEAFSSQEGYLGFLTSEKYRDEVIRSNWSHVGNNEDVVRIVLEFIGYDETHKAQDEALLAKNRQKILDVAQQAAEGLTFEGLCTPGSQNSPNLQSAITEAQREAIPCLQRLHVYDALKNGNPVGLGWNNESFIRDFPNSEYTPRIKQLMQEAISLSP